MRTKPHRSAVLGIFREAVGKDRVSENPEFLESQTSNLTEYAPKPFICAVRPDSVDAVHRAIDAANQTGVPLYPISSGFNWGLGSRVPPAPNCALLNLTDVNRIREIDAANRFAVIEPGVTQIQLADALREQCPHLMMNPTGSHQNSSVMGNCLERGVGFFGSRLADIRGIEVILGTGETVRTGFWRLHDGDDAVRPTHTYPAGVGPDLTGLFTQSNFGIVTGLVYDLRPRQPFTVALMEFAEREMPNVIDGLGKLRADGVISEGYELDNEHDPRVDGIARTGQSAEADRGDRWWAVWMRLPGTDRRIDAAKHHILRALGRHCARIEFIDPQVDDLSSRGDAFISRCDVLGGEPTNFSLEAMARASGVTDVPLDFNPDADTRVVGFVCCLPALPYHGDAIVQALDIVEAVSQKHGIVAALTMSGLSALTLEGFFRTYFDRTDLEAVATAHRWNRDLHRALSDVGIHPYRINIEQMQEYFPKNGNGTARTLATLKHTLDPNGIIAPGRYGAL